MSALVDRALAAAGLEGFLSRRLSGTLTADDRAGIEPMCRTLDLLLLGAMADRVRAHDRGAVVKIHIDRPNPPGRSAREDVRPREPEGAPADDEIITIAESESGHALSRRVACARLRGSARLALRVDCEALGLQIAQVMLAFGADELIAPVFKLTLEVYGEADAGAQERAVLREREIAALVRAARREPVVVQWRTGIATERAVDESSVAKRRFRAPGRDVRPEGEA